MSWLNASLYLQDIRNYTVKPWYSGAPWSCRKVTQSIGGILTPESDESTHIWVRPINWWAFKLSEAATARFISKLYCSPWKTLGVSENCRKESRGGQIPVFAGPVLWPSSAPGSTREHWQEVWESRQHAWDHLETPAISLAASVRSLGALTTS